MSVLTAKMFTLAMSALTAVFLNYQKDGAHIRSLTIYLTNSGRFEFSDIEKFKCQCFLCVKTQCLFCLQREYGFF